MFGIGAYLYETPDYSFGDYFWMLGVTVLIFLAALIWDLVKKWGKK